MHKWNTKDFAHKDMKWWDPDENNPFMVEQVEILKNILADKSFINLVEIGIGRGRITSILKGYAKHLIGLEINAEAIRLTRSKIPEVTLIQGDAQNLPFRNESFDGIICWATFMHLPDPEQFYMETYRILKYGGTLTYNMLRKGSRGHRRFIFSRIKNIIIRSNWLPDYHFDNLKHVIACCEAHGYKKTHLLMEETSVSIISFIKL